MPYIQQLDTNYLVKIQVCITDYIIVSKNSKIKNRPFRYLSYQNDRSYLVGAAGFPNRFALWIASVSRKYFAFGSDFRDVRYGPGGSSSSPKIKKQVSPFGAPCFLVGAAGFGPTRCRSQSPVPYRLATPQYGYSKNAHSFLTMGESRFIWGGGWDSNPRSSEPQSDALGQLRYIHHIGS